MATIGIFWNWSLKAYAAPETQRACLHLQDQFGQDVNVILWACWLASKKRCPTANALKHCIKITDIWQSGGVVGIRKARREIKDTPHIESASALKHQFLNLELAFERHEQLALEALPSQISPNTLNSSTKICLHNMKMVAPSTDFAHNNALETLSLTLY
ncbi:MAG: TIGR02444 family protein [Robiginitomaculum sp.]|nr:MAG: TIGR02444 family protein [Robiginitomaculum sp.]